MVIQLISQADWLARAQNLSKTSKTDQPYQLVSSLSYCLAEK